MEEKEKNACQVAEEVNSGRRSAGQLTEETLKRCKNLNGSLNIFIVINEDGALRQAEKVDRRIAGGEKMPLAGVPLAVKDDFCCSEMPTSFGSAAFKNFISPFSAAAVEAMLEAGCILIGKTNLDDMGMGSTTLSSPFGPSLNPWSGRYAAGSAGAAAVASRLSLLSLESDTGGALRTGASHCGVFGFRPTPGRISRYGLSAYSSSFSQGGVTALDTADLAEALRVLNGLDERDVTTALCREMPVDGEEELNLGAKKIGLWTGGGDVRSRLNYELIEQTGEKFRQCGFEIIEVAPKLFPEALRAYYVIAFAEASSNLSRYDGIRYGEAAEAGNLDQLYEQSRRLTFGEEARRRSIYGTFLLGKNRFEPYYRQAQKIWRLFREEMALLFKQCDLLLMPAVAGQAPLIEYKGSFLDFYEADFYSSPISLAGLPALAMPAGMAEEIPAGVQLVGPPLADELILKAAGMIAEKAKKPAVAEQKGRDL